VNQRRQISTITPGPERLRTPRAILPAAGRVPTAGQAAVRVNIITSRGGTLTLRTLVIRIPTARTIQTRGPVRPTIQIPIRTHRSGIRIIRTARRAEAAHHPITVVELREARRLRLQEDPTGGPEAVDSSFPLTQAL